MNGGPPPLPRTWTQRNWTWFVPVLVAGCLVLMAAFVAGIAAAVFASIRSSAPYAEAVARARSSPAVVEALGEPVATRWWVTGSIHVTNREGSARLAVPIRGPRGKGMVLLEADKRDGAWRYSLLEVAVDGVPQRIDLLPMVREPGP
jgi:hypothetical protein